jgi:hypothetical protein
MTKNYRFNPVITITYTIDNMPDIDIDACDYEHAREILSDYVHDLIKSGDIELSKPEIEIE